MPRASRHATPPPPAPIESTATIDIPVQRPKSSARVRRSGTPAEITATSKLVPPMSPVITSGSTIRRPTSCAAATPATGPDCARKTGFARASAGANVPPFDCITASGTASPAAASRPSTASRKAAQARAV
jgi:hypothetical protein